MRHKQQYSRNYSRRCTTTLHPLCSGQYVSQSYVSIHKLNWRRQSNFSLITSAEVKHIIFFCNTVLLHNWRGTFNDRRIIYTSTHMKCWKKENTWLTGRWPDIASTMVFRSKTSFGLLLASIQSEQKHRFLRKSSSICMNR